MKQIFIKKGKATAVEIPEPGIKKGFVKIAVNYSTISSGTEMTSVKISEKGILRRAIENPSKILKVIDIVKNQGVKNATSKVVTTVDKLNAIGYSVAGVITEVGEDVTEFSVGDIVSGGGSGFAVHADVVVVPKNLVVKIPTGLDVKYASTGTVGSIALHGVRRADLKIEEFGVVFGAGLLGLITLQALKSSGVKVACVDINTDRLQLAKELGADVIVNPADEDPVLLIKNWSDGHGADAVIFTAATEKDEPLSQAFRMCRRKGRVVLVGVSGMKIDRNDIYREEIDLLISTSYGPGRYDDNYELKGNDYPYAYVRWTENRNISAYLNLVNEKKINLEKLNPKVYPLEKANEAYENISASPNDHILSIIEFSPLHSPSEKRVQEPVLIQSTGSSSKIRIGIIGAGSFATSTLLPIIYENSSKFELKIVVNSTGDKAINVANQFKADKASSDPNDIFNDPNIDLVLICTRHNSHAELVLRALLAGKHVFVEKPLAISMEELNRIRAFYDTEGRKPILMVGFNRRFSSYANEIQKLVNERSGALVLRYRMNAGFVPYDSWIHDDGGRIIGEGCHMIDLVQYLTGSSIVDYSVSGIHSPTGRFKASDNRSIMLSFADGSVATIDYFSCGSNLLPKEYLEVHFDNKSIIMEDYKTLKGFGIKVKNIDSVNPAKGHKEEWLALYDNIKNGTWPISLESLLHTTEVSILVSR